MTDRSLPPIPPLPETSFARLPAAALGLQGDRVSYLERGRGPALPLLLMHGIGSHAGGWRFLLEDLGRERRVVAWNAPGYWLSEPFSHDAPRIEHYADAAAALLDALGIEVAHVVGSSFGGLCAAALAARHPRRVGHLVLLGTAAGFRRRPALERAQILAMRADSIREGAITLSETRWQRLVAPDSAPEVVRLVKSLLAAVHPRGMMQAARAIDQADLIGDFAPDIVAPTLVACGTEDLVNPLSVSEAVARAIPGATMQRLPEVGHISKLEAPRPLAALLRLHFGS